MSEGIEKDLPETSKVNAWLNTFIKAVHIVVPEWAIAYEMMKANDKTLSYRTLANDFRMQIVSRAKGNKGFKPGAFGPTYGHDQLDQSDEVSGDASNEKG